MTYPCGDAEQTRSMDVARRLLRSSHAEAYIYDPYIHDPCICEPSVCEAYTKRKQRSSLKPPPLVGAGLDWDGLGILSPEESS